MKIRRTLRHLLLAAAGLATAAGATAALPEAASGVAQPFELPAITTRQTPIDASGEYRRELQACRSGASNQPMASCLEEVRNAHASRRRGQLALPGEDYKANALARCLPLSGEDRAACEARVMGFGNTSGSVAGGGLLRWVETVVLPPSKSEVSFAPKTAEPWSSFRCPGSSDPQRATLAGACIPINTRRS